MKRLTQPCGQGYPGRTAQPMGRDQYTGCATAIEWCIVVPGEPMAKARARTVGTGKFIRRGGRTHEITRQHQDPETVKYETLVREYWGIHHPGHTPLPKGTMLTVSVEAFFSIPPSESYYNQVLMAGGVIRPTKTPDYDNLAKVFTDALNQVAYFDDSQVVIGRQEKWYSVRPRVVFTMRLWLPPAGLRERVEAVYQEARKMRQRVPLAELDLYTGHPSAAERRPNLGPRSEKNGGQP